MVKSLKRGGKDTKAAQTEACAAISYAPFRFSNQLKEWPNVKGPIGSHTKFLMVDEAAFYIGSHNLYQANLQEYGNIITDVEASKQILSAYWDKIWEASKGSQLPCPY
jgi:phosphatidylserine/phosphatidylglycerophosphate/cardiolipin synthase-like enzyme